MQNKHGRNISEMTFNGREEIYKWMTRDGKNGEREGCIERIRTFIARRNNNERYVKKQDIYILACAGFECRDNNIRCAYCLKELKIEEEEPRMNLKQILEKHKKIELECKYLIPYVQKPVYENMQSVRERRKSFKKIIKRIHEEFSRISVDHFILMGLFYKEDTTKYLVCYQCGIKIEYDELDKHKTVDSLWRIHANQKRYCTKVILYKGISYQEKYQQTDDPYKEEMRIRMLIDEAYREAREIANYIKHCELEKC